MTRLWDRRLRLGAAVIAAVAAILGAAPLLRAQISPDTIEQAIPRTVQLGILVPVKGEPGRFRVVGRCSGAFVSPSGFILTASHCVRATDDGEAVAKGQLYSPDGLLSVSINVPDQVRPVLTMIAAYVADDVELDMALLRVRELIGRGGQPLPGDFRVPFMVLGNANGVRHGDPIAVVGFPGVGGETITINQGHVSGFTADAQNRRFEIKIDTEAAGGSSGGPVINARGEQVAVYSGRQLNPSRVERSGRATLISRVPGDWLQALQGRGSPTPSPARPQPSQPRLPGEATAVLQGRIVDASTGAGIQGASVYVLKPGATPRAATREDVLTTGVADASGAFQTSPPIRRGAEYPVMVLAAGYQGASGTVTLAATGPEIFSMGTIRLPRE